MDGSPREQRERRTGSVPDRVPTTFEDPRLMRRRILARRETSEAKGSPREQRERRTK